MMKITFAAAITVIFFAYFGYPLSLYLIGLLRKREVKKSTYFPRVTVIITAHNEEKRIREKIDNTLALVYPPEKMQVIVASDGSTDRTNDIVEKCDVEYLELLALPGRRGKEHAQREALKSATGDVIVFTDVATAIDRDGLRNIVFNFSDPTVGCVSSEERLIESDGGVSGEWFYVKLEMLLRRLESRVSSFVGLNGSFFALRSEVCRDFSGQLEGDFRIVLSCVRKGLRAVSDQSAIGYYPDVGETKHEVERKTRTVLRELTVFFHHLEFLNPFTYGLFSYQYLCHKLLRWLVPFFLVIAFVANLPLAADSFGFFLLFMGQVAFYTMGFWSWRIGTPESRTIFTVPLYFVSLNYSILSAWVKYRSGERVAMWKPSER